MHACQVRDSHSLFVCCFSVRLSFSRNPAFGLRDIADVSAAGADSFRLLSVKDMPSNNFFLTFVKESASAQNAAAL